MWCIVSRSYDATQCQQGSVQLYLADLQQPDTWTQCPVLQAAAHRCCWGQVWGPLIFESRRWVELRGKSFWRQFLSAESTGMGIFYTLNVFCIQARPVSKTLIGSPRCACGVQLLR